MSNLRIWSFSIKFWEHKELKNCWKSVKSQSACDRTRARHLLGVSPRGSFSNNQRLPDLQHHHLLENKFLNLFTVPESISGSSLFLYRFHPGTKTSWLPETNLVVQGFLALHKISFFKWSPPRGLSEAVAPIHAFEIRGSGGRQLPVVQLCLNLGVTVLLSHNPSFNKIYHLRRGATYHLLPQMMRNRLKTQFFSERTLVEKQALGSHFCFCPSQSSRFQQAGSHTCPCPHDEGS